MNPYAPYSTVRRTWPLSLGTVILIGVPLVLLLGVIGITGYFRLSSETNALRQSVMNSVPGTWNKKIALHVGAVTTAVVRAGSRYLKLGPEPRAALDAVHGASVGIYKLQQEIQPMDAGVILSHADKAMSSHGWVRAFAFSKERQLVAVYSPQRGLSARSLKCCLLVLQDRDLVVVSAHGNLEPLFDIVRNHLDLDRAEPYLALR